MPPLPALVPLILLVVGFLGFCFYDLARSEVQYLPKWVWALIICASFPIGGITYLAMGKKHT